MENSGETQAGPAHPQGARAEDGQSQWIGQRQPGADGDARMPQKLSGGAAPGYLEREGTTPKSPKEPKERSQSAGNAFPKAGQTRSLEEAPKQEQLTRQQLPPQIPELG